jgi:kanosamine 6-kinase
LITRLTIALEMFIPSTVQDFDHRRTRIDPGGTRCGREVIGAAYERNLDGAGVERTGHRDHSSLDMDCRSLCRSLKIIYDGFLSAHTPTPPVMRGDYRTVPGNSAVFSNMNIWAIRSGRSAATSPGVIISYLGIDIGGTKVAFRAAGDGPEVYEAAFFWPLSGTVSQDLGALAASIAALRRRCPEPIEAVGVAMPATVDGTGRVIAWPGRPSWTGVDLRTSLNEFCPGAAVRWADDGEVATIAEASAADCEDLVYVGVGTGIGGGIMLGGHLCPGSARGSCEIGHMVVDRSGARCDCGRQGCVQATASGPATLRRAAALRGGEVTYAELRAALRELQPWAVAAVQESCAALAAALVSLDELVHPQQISIGGGFAAGLPGFVSEVSRHAADLVRAGQQPLPLRAAAFGGLASLHGAVLLARGVS